MSWHSLVCSYRQAGPAQLRFAATGEVIAALDDLFGYDGTLEFLKDNLFEVFKFNLESVIIFLFRTFTFSIILIFFLYTGLHTGVVGKDESMGHFSPEFLRVVSTRA